MSSKTGVNDDAVKRAGLDRLLTVQEAAAILRCSVSSLNKWRLTGDGPSFVRVGARVRYCPADIAGFVKRETRNSTAEVK